MGIDIGGTKIEALLLDESGHELGRRRIATPRGDYEGGLAAIAKLVEGLEKTAVKRADVAGIGFPGALSPQTGLVKNANSVWLIGKPLGRDLAAFLKRPIRLTNDANCFAMSEANGGAAAGAKIVFGVILGTGVGAGIVIDGNVLDGHNAIAGEWGHNPLPWPEESERPGRLCYCGKQGCIETFLSGPGLAADHEAMTGEKLGGPAIVTRAEAGEVKAVATLARYEARLARALAMVINIIDPDVIVLGGGLGQVKRLYQTVPALVPPWCFSDHVEIDIRLPKFGDASGARGAAYLWSGSGT